MKKTTLKIDGMMCPMCESHVNDAVRAAISPKKVTSSHKAGETVVITDGDIDAAALTEAIESGGYKVLSYSTEEYEKKGFFARIFGK